jgi:hypothetical protein
LDPSGNPISFAAFFCEGKEDAMADDLSKKGPQDRSRINSDEDYELRYWCQKFGVSEALLKAAVAKVGNSAEAVEKELRGERSGVL